MPELAYEAVRVEMTMADEGIAVRDLPMQVARRNEVTPVIHIA